jgi:hypothetical protein
MRRLSAFLVLLALALVPAAASSGAEDDPAQVVKRANDALAVRGLDVGISEIHFFEIGEGRPELRIHQQGSRFAPGDPRRGGGRSLTYLVDGSDGATTSGLTSAQTSAAIGRAFATWNADKCFASTGATEVPDSGADPDLLDGLVGYGDAADPGAADIVNGGWLPRGFFELLGGPGGGRGLLALTATFTFLDDEGNPTDIDGDNYGDVAFVEIYFNDNFGNPAGDRSRNPWQIGGRLPAIDVQSVALHEAGHSLGLGHFASGGRAVMSSPYSGLLQDLQPLDHAGLCAVWSSAPSRT